jgi:3-hydroxyisobutyrate dehydrogenase
MALAAGLRRVCFIGLGAMGRPMAANLAAAQFQVAAFDISVAAREALAARAPAVSVHDQVRAAAGGAEAIVLMVVNIAQAEAALFEAGTLAASSAEALVILMATCPPGDVAALAARVEATGRRFVDAPVSGGVVGAEAASLTIMAGASAETFAAARPLLAAMGSKVFHVGAEPGQGAVVKTVNQLLCGVHIAAAAEGLALAEKAGIDGRLFLEILGGSAAASWMLGNRGPRMLEDEPQVTSAVDIFVKDLGIVLDAGRDSKVATPLAASAFQMFLAASANGWGKADDSQVVRVYRRLAGLKDEA